MVRTALFSPFEIIEGDRSRGLVLLAQPVADASGRLPLAPGIEPVPQLDRTLCEIAARYGDARRDWVMQEMEYPGLQGACAR